MILQQPVDPFPDPIHAGQEIENIGLMFGSILLILVLIVLMIYLYKNFKSELPLIVVYLFSLIIGLNSFIYNIPFTPFIQLFFIFFQSSIFLMKGLDEFNKNKRKKRGY